MNARMTRTIVLMIAVLVLMTAGIIVAAVQGSAAGVLLTVIVSTLVLSYAVRHGIRSKHVYRQRV